MGVKKWPFSQNDSRWRKEKMWDRQTVLDILRTHEGFTEREASEWLEVYEDGNTIGNEGCQITCLAMVLKLLDDRTKKLDWNPRRLHKLAQNGLYYSSCGVSLVQLYADLCCDATEGRVQLLAKEEFLAGEYRSRATFAADSSLLRFYRGLEKKLQRDFAAMVKMGTYDDTFASHYVLVDPSAPGDPDQNDFRVLDPAEPIHSNDRIWNLSNSFSYLHENGKSKIGMEWHRLGIKPLQIAGVWLFGRKALFSLACLKNTECRSVK